MKSAAILSVTVCLAVVAGCKDSRRPASAAVHSRVVDSILPMDEQLRRFQRGLPVVVRLEGGAGTRDSLIALFVAALEANDTSALVRMSVGRHEYAHVYFPSSLYMRKPYELAPDLAWLLHLQESEKGLVRLLRRLGGAKLELRGYRCPRDVREEGDNRLHGPCTVDYTHPGEGSVTRRLFGVILERHGSFKFLSYANDF